MSDKAIRYGFSEITRDIKDSRTANEIINGVCGEEWREFTGSYVHENGKAVARHIEQDPFHPELLFCVLCGDTRPAIFVNVFNNVLRLGEKRETSKYVSANNELFSCGVTRAGGRDFSTCVHMWTIADDHIDE